MGSEKFSNSAKSGYNEGTIRSDIRYLVVSKDVRRHRLISIDSVTAEVAPQKELGGAWRNHRGREKGAFRAPFVPFVAAMRERRPAVQGVIRSPHWNKRATTRPPLALHVSPE